MTQTIKQKTTPWLVPVGAASDIEHKEFTTACRGHVQIGKVLGYLIVAASWQESHSGGDVTTCEVVELADITHKKILAQVKISQNSLTTYLKQLATWGYIQADSYRHTYRVYPQKINEAVTTPPPLLEKKPRGKHALHGTVITPFPVLKMEGEDARLVQLQIRRVELLTELKTIEDELVQFTFIIYGCVDPRDMTVFYVGIALDGERRFKQHLSCNDENEAKNARIQEILDLGLTPIFPELEVIQGKAHALAREQYWIDFFLKRGIHLVNAEGRKAV